MRWGECMNEIKTYQDDPKVQRNRWLIFAILNMFTFMATLDGSIVNIALPVISTNLHLPIAELQWVVTAYLMAICAFVLFFGKLGDNIGKVKIFRVGAFVFIIGSFLCGLSYTLPLLVTARVIQAVGASMTMAVSMGIITDVFPINERGKALGLIGTVVSLGSIAGPALGGFIVTAFGWEYIFWVNVPIGFVLFIVGAKLLPKDLNTRKIVLDVAGSFLFATFIVLFFASILLGQQVGYKDIRIVGAFLVAIVSLIVFIQVELRKKQPMLQLLVVLVVLALFQ